LRLLQIFTEQREGCYTPWAILMIVVVSLDEYTRKEEPMNVRGRPQRPTQPTFGDLCQKLLPSLSALQDLAVSAGVSKNIVDAMFDGIPVAPSDAAAVLAAFSQRVGQTWTLTTLDIPLIRQPENDGPILPYLGDLYVRHGFSAPLLATQAGVSLEVITRMGVQEPVSRQDAIAVLAALSLRTGETYTLQTVVVNLLEEDTNETN
jgi:hypothetical protein